MRIGITSSAVQPDAPTSRPSTAPLFAALLALAWIAWAPSAIAADGEIAPNPQAAVTPATQTIEHLTRVGQSTIHATAIGSGAFAAPETLEEHETGLKGQAALRSAAPTRQRRVNLPIPSKEAARLRLAEFRSSSADARIAALAPAEPVVRGDKVVHFQEEGFSSFNGLSHVDQRTANGGNQFSIEPPDQALCVGNGYVVEAVNDVIRVFDTSGTPLTGVEDLNTFFGLAAQVVRGPPRVNGPFLSDPKCFYDKQTRRWFVSELMEDNGNNEGATIRNFNLLAVSQTSDPTGAFTVFKYDVTDDGLKGTPNHGGCPCFGDQPLLGADKFGIYQSTNEFGGTFNGAQIYAISKAALVAAADSPGSPLPVVVHIDASQQLVPFGGLSYSIQPAVSPKAGKNNDDNDDDGGFRVRTGVEYFLSALQFGVAGTPDEHFDNRIAVWALTNTRSLNTDFPTLTLSFDVIRSETYGQPDNADQKPGPIPLGMSLDPPEPLELIQTNDDRMNQVVFANGRLYSGVNTKLTVAGESRTGIAWFAVKPKFEGPTLKGRVVRQGYVAVAGNNVMYPSVGVNRDGEGAIGVTLVGPDYFPSAAYAVLNEGGTSPFVHVAAAGQGPEDGFTGYKAFGGNGAARWGDYSAAVWDGERIWFANEYIPTSCAVNALPCRTMLANWGTRISKVKP